MKQNLKNNRKQAKPMSPWIKYCMIAAAALLVLAGVLYAVRYISLDREFHYNVKHFGEETYGEIFALQDSKDNAEPVMELGEEAFSFIGTEEEAEARFGLLSRYSVTEAEADSQEYSLDYIISKMDEKSGYVWIAYTQHIYDSEGQLLSGAGTKEERILARWSVEKQNDQWVVTRIQEGP